MGIVARKPLVTVDMPIVDHESRLVSQGQLARARAALEAKAAGLSNRAWRVELLLGDDSPPLLVDCKAGTVTEGSGPFSNVDCSLTLTPGDLQQLMAGSDPRPFIIYQRLKVHGSVEAAFDFCDRLGGREIVNVLKLDKELPTPTTDLKLAKAELDEFGYCLIKDAITPEQTQALRTRLAEQAAAEAAIERANRASGTKSGIPPIQRVSNLSNKGQVFLDLLDHPLIDEIIFENLGEHFLLSSYTSKIAGPGCDAQFLHYDQIGIRPPLPHVNTGLNLFFFLDPFTDANGGTRLIPGSHRPEYGFAPANIFTTYGSIAAEGLAGTALIFETRLWHGTGANRTEARRHGLFMLFERSWLRPHENSTISLRPAVLEGMSERLKIMHGFRCTRSAGGVEGPVEGEIVRRDWENTLPELRLAPPN